MTATVSRKYDVGGVALDRPFKIRRLGHFGFNATDVEACRRFYFDLLGFRVSDASSGGSGYFGRYGSDHHAFVLASKKVAEERMRARGGEARYRPENDINQITWQVQSLREMVEATRYFREHGHQIINEGRAGGAGSNWHLYIYDPDDQITELFYGIEQIGWDGYSKPVPARRGMRTAPTEPQLPECAEVDESLAQGIDLHSGYRGVERNPLSYEVDGILLPRPFKIVRIGPVRLFADSVEASVAYYREMLGFEVTEEVEWQDGRAVYLRCDNEHHSLAIFPRAWRQRLGLSPRTSCVSFSLQLANYRQLKDAVAFLRENGVRVETDTVPLVLHPGIDYAAYAFDPEGRCIELYYYMEQVGWDGRPRPASLRRRVDPHHWPEVLEPLPDTYRGEPFLGPWA